MYRSCCKSWLVLLTLGATLLAGCIDGNRRPADDDDSEPGDDDDSGTSDDDDSVDDDDVSGDCETEGATECVGPDFMMCTAGDWELVETCVSPTAICDDALGCLVCDPGSTWCEDDAVMICDDDGLGSSVLEDCAGGDVCVGGECLDGCATAEAQMSYLGCSFIAASTVNAGLLPVFDNDFAVVIGNPDSAPAEVTVRRGGSVVATETVPPGLTAAIELPMVAELQGATELSMIVPDGAYEVESSVPVAAYQFNPLHFAIGGSNSYSNDASMLLPEHALTGNYMAGTFPSFGAGSYFLPSFLAVVGTVDGTQVTLVSSTNTAEGTPAPLTPGDSTTFTLDRGDVAQVVSYQPGAVDCAAMGWPQSSDLVFCWGLDGDLTGSTVTASEPVAVFAGHECTFLPFDSPACDHLEEMMFPTETWGTQVVMSALSLPDASGVAEAIYRVIALDDATGVSFEPAVHPTATLGSGEFVEFTTDQDFVVDSTGPVYVWQGAHGALAMGSGAQGDPAMGSGIPQLQVRDRYDFLTPGTYVTNWVNVVAPSGTSIELDGSPVSGWQPISSTGFDVARVQLGLGSHHIESADGTPFSITSYGYADYTSYLYPGGMNLIR